MKRRTKFYRKNEAEVMDSLGLVATINSGSGWIEKSDGQNENIICELKSTDAQSIRVHKQDLDKLEYNALTAHKIPVFAIQFLETGEVWLLTKPDDLCEAAKFITTGEREESIIGVDLSNTKDMTVRVKKEIKSSSSARDEFKEQQQKRFRKDKSAL